MSIIRTLAGAILISGAALGSNYASAADLAERGYPITTGHAETAEVDYGPDALKHNVIGGGVVADVKRLNGETEAVYAPTAKRQAPPRNLVPVEIGSGESAQEMWVPMDEAPTAAAGGSAPIDAIGG